MNASRVKEIVKEWRRKDEIFMAFYDKDEADDYIASNLWGNKKLTKAEWLEIVREMEVDDGIWTELTGAFRYHIEQTIKRRERNESERTERPA